MDYYREIMQLIGTCVDALGVLIIVIGAAIATVRFLLGRRTDFNLAYRSYRQGLGRAILPGLEFLIAGDIIRPADGRLRAPAQGSVIPSWSNRNAR